MKDENFSFLGGMKTFLSCVHNAGKFSSFFQGKKTHLTPVTAEVSRNLIEAQADENLELLK